MSKRSAKMSFGGHQITIYHRAGVERVVEPGYAILAEDRGWTIYATPEKAVRPDDWVLQHGATKEQWAAALAEYERRTATRR